LPKGGKMEEDNNGKQHRVIKKESKANVIVWETLTTVLGILLVISLFTGGFGIGSDASGAAVAEAQQAQARAPSAQQAPTEINVEGLLFRGAEDAKVIIVEYSSFSCGFCNRVRTTLDQILETYPDDVKIVYKHFNRGGTDSITAQAAECAGDQGKFWEMHDIIFDKGSSSDVKGYAKDIGLNTNGFAECLDSEKYASKVTEDTSEGKSLGVRGTPSFSINGKLVVGAQPFANFKQIIDAELAK